VFGVAGEDSGATFVFECDNENELERWTNAIAQRCEALILEAIDATPKSSSATRLAEHVALAGNDRCADCGVQPVEWASAKRGVTLCVNCSGVHRAMGVQHSVVRSLTLDDWPLQVLNEFVGYGGNRNVNRLLESLLPPALESTRNAATSDVLLSRASNPAYQREAFARQKYAFDYCTDSFSAEWIALMTRQSMDATASAEFS